MRTKLRRASWCAVGVGSIPAALLGVLYIVGPIWILVVAILSMFLARFSRLDHAFAALGIVALLLLFISLGQQTTDRSQGRLEWFLKWSVFYLSLYAMTIAAAKLGRIAGVALGDSRA